MARGTHQRDPINNEYWFFVEGKDQDGGKRYAQTYLHLAATHFVTFGEIFMLLAEANQANEARANIQLEQLQEKIEEAKRDAELLSKFDLPD